MALPASDYFPSLDICLRSNTRLLSFRLAYNTLTTSPNFDSVEVFLNDGQVIEYLINAAYPFPPASRKSKDAFETKTAPIQIGSASNGEYNLEHMKVDASWLSEKIGVDEVVALRVVILEWQTRAEDRLLHTGKNVPIDFTQSEGGTTRFAASFSASASVTQPPTIDLGKEDVRRDRQLRIYLDEKSCILKIAAILAGQSAVVKTGSIGKTWLDDLAEKVANARCKAADVVEQEQVISRHVDGIARKIHTLDIHAKIPEAFTTDDIKRLMHAEATFQDIISSLQLLLANLYEFDVIPAPTTTLPWFKLMDRVGFFQNLTPSPAWPSPSTLQCLAALVSLQMLRVGSVLNKLQDHAVPVLGSGSRYPDLTVQRVPDAYWLNDSCMRELNLIFYHAAQANAVVAAPAIYAWSLLSSVIRDIAKLQADRREQRRLEDGPPDVGVGERQASRQDLRDEANQFERQFAILQDFDLDADAREDPPAFFIRTSVDGMNVYGIISQISTAITSMYSSDMEAPVACVGRKALLELVKEAMPVVAYGAEVLDAILSVISPDVPCRSSKLDPLLASDFFQDSSVLREQILDQASARYPFELSPLLRLLTSLACVSNDYIIQILDEMKTMTIMIPDSFRAYTLDHEDDNMNSMSLTDKLPLFTTKQALSFFGRGLNSRKALTAGSGEDEANSNVLSVPAGTSGIVVKESRPLVFTLQHQHSAFEYLSILLSTLLPNAELFTTLPDARLDRPTAAEIVSLLNALLVTSLTQADRFERGSAILSRLSSALAPQHDITSIIADLMEAELLAHLDQSMEDGSLELLVACAEFFDSLLTISPQRVWSILARSSILGVNGGPNAMAAVVGGTETQTGRFAFLAVCVRMYSRLIDDAVTGLVKRKALNANKQSHRFDSPVQEADVTPERTMKAVLRAYGIAMLDAWQSLTEWRFAVPSERATVVSGLLSAFRELIQVTYGIQHAASHQKSGTGLAGWMFDASRVIIDALAPPDGEDASLQVFAQLFEGAIEIVNDDSHPVQIRAGIIKQTNAAFAVLTTLIRTTKIIDGSGSSTHRISAQLFKSMSCFATLFVREHAFKKPLSSLLAEMVLSSDGRVKDKDIPSLLGYLEAESAKAFLEVLAQLDRPLADVEVESEIWSFMSAVMSSKQQWFALYLLTGNLPKHILKDKEQGMKGNDQSMLAYALQQLSSVATLPPERAIAMLNFVAAAQETWVWATAQIRAHPEFLKQTLTWISSLQMPSRQPNLAEELLLANEHQMAAYLCDVLAGCLYANSEIGDAELTRILVTNDRLRFLRDYGAVVSAYNRSLHRNLGENFSRRFKGVQVNEFSRTPANPAGRFGRDWQYDLQVMERILGHETAWHGSAGHNRVGQGFADEVARANMNISLVDAQERLLRSWTTLTTIMSSCLEHDPLVEVLLAQTALKYLQANIDTDLDVPGMDEAVKLRAESAFVLVSKLVAKESPAEGMKNLLSAAWSLVRSSPVDYDVATSQGHLEYFRTLLRILFLSLQPWIYLKASGPGKIGHDFLDPGTSSMLIEIVGKVISLGFRALCGNLHNGILLAQPGDFALITALLRGVLSVKGMDAVYPQVAEVVASTSLVRGALSLYSWSDQLALNADSDPVYGEVAIAFLVTLSTVPQIAEQIGLEGALSQLASANLSNYFRKSPLGKGPFDEPRRMFPIWNEGFLPLVVNLLDAVGPPIVTEVTSFLNSFPLQLRRANTALENRAPSSAQPHAGQITLSLVSEVHSLCIISSILRSDVARGAAEGIDAGAVPPLAFEEKKVREDARSLIRQKTSLASRIVAVDPREEIWAGQSSPGPYSNLLEAKIQKEVQALVAEW